MGIEDALADEGQQHQRPLVARRVERGARPSASGRSLELGHARFSSDVACLLNVRDRALGLATAR